METIMTTTCEWCDELKLTNEMVDGVCIQCRTCNECGEVQDSTGFMTDYGCCWDCIDRHDEGELS